jgi:hypothetical protein
MSALLNLNPIPMISWKGQTFNQIHSSIQKNGQLPVEYTSSKQMFSARPLKIYRREIANTSQEPCNSRASLQIGAFNRPGGTIINSTSENPNGLVNIIDMLLPNNTCENFNNCSVILSPADNAKNRVRSSGMIRRKFNENKNNDTYYTSSSQYLNSRNRTFAQNQYNYIRQGNSTAKPGSSLASANVYSPQGLNHCQKYYIAQDTAFQYMWINKLDTDRITTIPNTDMYVVNIPAGYYTVDDINRIFKQTMFTNLHFFIKNPTGSTDEYYSENISYALNIAYNNNNEKVELQSYRIDDEEFPVDNFTIPTELIDNNPVARWSRPEFGTGLFPQFVIIDNIFKHAVGFAPALYPLTNATLDAKYQAFISSVSPGIKPLYVKLHYKPSNPQFAQQGAVSAGDLITRKKYNSITKSTSAYRTAFGNSVANALAYGVPENGYTVKDKLGFPLKKTPTFTKYSEEMKTCSVTSFANAI